MTPIRDSRLAALAACVDHGIDDGWRQARRIAKQPTQAQWRDAIYQAVMQRIENCLLSNQPQEDNV